MKTLDRSKNYMFLSATICAISVALLAIATIFIQLRSVNRLVNHQISIDGSGYVNVVPNVALINLYVRQVEKVQKDAQQVVKEKVQSVLKNLSELGISPEDIKTEGYNLAPKYEYPQAPSCLRAPCPPQPKPILIGYEASQAISVKVRKTEQVDTIFEQLGKLGVTEFSGPNFVVDDLGKSREEARFKAIADAKIKAEKLAKELGVNLGRISSFMEQDIPIRPMMYRVKEDMMAGVPSPYSANGSSIPAGETKITSNVIITYEIW